MCSHLCSLTDSGNPEPPTQDHVTEWWWGEDLNLRRLRRQIYSLFPLATREPHRITSGADTPIRTEDILITSETLYQLSYIGSILTSSLLERTTPYSNHIATIQTS